jgi:tetratricopeptide (TPR) repeat protein
VKHLPLIMGTFMLVMGHTAAAEGPAKSRLDSCISYYKDGDYQKAVDSIMVLLTLISDRREEAEAYKYLGFSYVMLDKIDKAKEYFGVALEKFPRMTIDTLEVPPNIVAVFKLARFETGGKEPQEKAAPKPAPKPALASALTAIGTISAGVGGYFFYKAYQAHREYRNVNYAHTLYPDFDTPWNRMKRDLIIGSCAAGAAAVSLYFGLRLLFRKPAEPASSQKLGVTFEGNGIAVTAEF